MIQTFKKMNDILMKSDENRDKTETLHASRLYKSIFDTDHFTEKTLKLFKALLICSKNTEHLKCSYDYCFLLTPLALKCQELGLTSVNVRAILKSAILNDKGLPKIISKV